MNVNMKKNKQQENLIEIQIVQHSKQIKVIDEIDFKTEQKEQ